MGWDTETDTDLSDGKRVEWAGFDGCLVSGVAGEEGGKHFEGPSSAGVPGSSDYRKNMSYVGF